MRRRAGGRTRLCSQRQAEKPVAYRKSMRHAVFADVYESAKPLAVPVALTVLAGAPFLLLFMLVPRPFLMPLFCLSAIALSALTALVAWIVRENRHGNRVTLWDAAGALAFIACAAAVLSKPDDAMQLFGIAPIP
jgi:hypothetical protein